MRTPPRPRGRLRAAAIAAAASLALLHASACDPAVDESSGDAVDMPLERAAGFLDITVPAEATDARWRYESQRQEDTVLISFVLPTDRVDAFLTTARTDPLVDGGSYSGASFAKLNLPEPATRPGVRNTSRTPDPDLSALDVDIVPEDTGHSRVYLFGW